MEFDLSIRASLHHSIEDAKLYKQKPLPTVQTPGWTLQNTSDNYYMDDAFYVLYLSVLNNNGRAHSIGAYPTQISTRAFLSVITSIIKTYGGYLAGISNHGVTVLFPESNAMSSSQACSCGTMLLEGVINLINPSLKREDILWTYSCGVGISYGKVIGVQTGIDSMQEMIFYGDCILAAATSGLWASRLM